MRFKARWTQTYVYTVDIDAPDIKTATRIARRIDHEMINALADAADAADEEDEDDNADLFEPILVDGVEYVVDQDVDGGIATLKVTPVGGSPTPKTPKTTDSKPAGLRLIKGDVK